ncbi:MAG: ferritin family protein [Candidatus Berkelbacteria bacterium]
MTKLFVCGVCGKEIIGDGVCNCPFCGAHKQHISEYKTNKLKWRCSVCNNFFDKVPSVCPVCSASSSKFVQVPENELADDKLVLSKTDKGNAKKAFAIEVSNSTFYFCAAEKSDKDEERKLFRALGKIEFEHAEIWQKILGIKELPKSSDGCVASSLANLKEAFSREDAAIKFYAEAAESSDSPRMKMLFSTLVEIENDHLDMSSGRIKSFN